MANPEHLAIESAIKHRVPTKQKYVPPDLTIHVGNASDATANKLAKSLQRAFPTSNVQIHQFRVDYKLNLWEPGRVLFEHLVIFIKAHKDLATAGGIYTGKKIIDAIFEVAKNWAMQRGKEQGTRIYLYGADGAIARVVEVAEGKARTVTSAWKGRKINFPPWIKP